MSLINSEQSGVFVDLRPFYYQVFQWAGLGSASYSLSTSGDPVWPVYSQEHFPAWSLENMGLHMSLEA